MALSRQSDSDITYLQVKHFSLWKEIKKPVEGCESIEVTNPRTKEVIVKHGYKYRTVTGHATKLEKYDREHQGTRYFGFKLRLQDGADAYSLDLPYQSQILRRFLRVARNIDWSEPLSISVFKGKGREGGKNSEETGVWFQQGGETIKPYYTREEPHGMPPAVQDPHTHEWDFKAQHRWLVARLVEETMPDIEKAAARTAPPIEPEHHHQQGDPWDGDEGPENAMDGITDDDIPF